MNLRKEFAMTKEGKAKITRTKKQGFEYSSCLKCSLRKWAIAKIEA
ncbi:MAG: hypothetical protein GX587_14680 [Bacteroidales bacterium]|nr:hypothetical protein [Bacteroidales bacterium]